MAKKPRHVVVAVECDLPPGVSAAELKRYVVAEVKANVGSRHPDDPLFNLNRQTVRGTIIPRSIDWFFNRTRGGMASPLYRR